MCSVFACLMLTAVAHSYIVVPGHEYRVELDVSNFIGSVVSLSYVEIVVDHQPAFVDSVYESSGEEFVGPGDSHTFQLDFTIASGSWGQSDTLKVTMQFGNTFIVEPDSWYVEIPLEAVAECSVSCQGIAEGEPYFTGSDTYNGGCNSSPPVFQSIDCGDTICGTAFTFYIAPYNYRDTDWYQCTVTQPSSFRWEVEAEFPLYMMVIDGSYGCENLGYIDYDYADSCGMGVIETDCLPAGTYWFFVCPQSFTEHPEEVPYRAVLTCDTCSTTHPCELQEELLCEEIVEWNNGSGTDHWVTYPHCQGYGQTGPENVFHIQIPYDGTVLTATLSDMQADLDLFILDDCSYDACLDGAGDTLIVELDQGDYYLVVDGYFGAVSDYTMIVTCDVLEPPAPLVTIQLLDSTSIELNWDYQEPVDYFNIYRSDSLESYDPLTDLIGTSDSTSFVDQGVLTTTATEYFYWVTAVRIPRRSLSSTGGPGWLRTESFNYSDRMKIH